ncbi:MAG: PQQ-dependent sugar dehydrogenase [Rhodothermales bacterium]
MLTMRTTAATFILLLALAGCSSDSSMPEASAWRAVAEAYDCDADNGDIMLAEGFCALVVADSVGNARHLAVRDNGDIYIALQGRSDDQVGIVALRDTTGDGRADVFARFGSTKGTDVAFHNGYLYYSTDTTIVRYPLGAGELVPSAPYETVVRGFIAQNQHASKPFAFDEAGHLYVTIGAPSNACQVQMRTPGSPGQDPCPQLERQAGIWRFDAERLGQTQEADGYRFATGIRNAMGLAWDPATKSIYATQHGRDDLARLFPDLFTAEQSADLPAEEFYKVNDGTNLGWPFCYYDQIQGRRVRGPEYGGDGTSTEGCESYQNPLVAFPGHYAPNDLIFIEGDQYPARYRNGALIAFHGSWNRFDPRGQKGYLVAFVPMDNGNVAGDWEIFADGFSGKEMIGNPGEAAYRPMGLAQGPDGTVYIADSMKGKIWRVIYAGANLAQAN